MPSTSWLRAGGVSVSEWHCPGAERVIGEAEAPRAFEVSVVRAGAYQRRLEDRTVLADATRLVCGNPGELFRPVHTLGQPARETVVALEESAFRGLLREVDPRAADTSAARFPADWLSLHGRTALAHGALLRARADGDALALQELAFALAALALRTRAPSRRARPRLTARTLEAVHVTRRTLGQRFGERLTLDALARHAGLTPWHLSRAFRTATGESIHRHLLRLRLNATLERIALRENNLTRIALETGFSSHSHFTAAFRRAFGTTPSRALAGTRPRGLWTRAPAACNLP